METRILIIEDVASDAKLLELEVLKYNSAAKIEITDSFKEIEHVLFDFKPQVILSDFDLRLFTAFDVLAVLKKYELNIPCVIVTGVINDEEIVAELILKGAVGFIQKRDLSHIGTSLKKILDDLNTSFSSNFEIYETKLRMLFKLREIQYNFNRLAMDIPQMTKFNREFSQFTEDMILEIESGFNKLSLLKDDQDN